jgi:hypothetical protein
LREVLDGYHQHAGASEVTLVCQRKTPRQAVKVEELLDTLVSANSQAAVNINTV